MNSVEEYNKVNEVTPKSWFPFSRIGIFFFCILVGVSVVSAMALTVTRIVPMVLEIINGASLAQVEAEGIANENTANWIPLMMGIAYAVVIPISLLIVKNVPSQKDLPKQKWKASKLLFFATLSMGVGMIGNIVSLLIVAVIRLATGLQMNTPVNDILNENNIIGSLILVVIIAPVVEEFLFRKILIDRVRVYGDKVAIILSGVIFGLFHGNIFQAVYATLLGMIMAYVYLNSNQLKYCIGLHMVLNIFGGAIPMLLNKNVDLEQMSHEPMEAWAEAAPQILMLGGLALLRIACMVVGIVLLVVWRDKIILRPGLVAIEKGQKFKTICVNTGMILYFVVTLSLFIFSAMN